LEQEEREDREAAGYYPHHPHHCTSESRLLAKNSLGRDFRIVRGRRPRLSMTPFDPKGRTDVGQETRAV
jgi:hypothetical protein